MSKEKHCAQAHDIDGTLLLEGLNQYEAIQAARKTDPVAERVYNRLYDLYIRDGKASDLLARKYNPAKGADKAAFICMCFSHEFWNKLRKRQGQIARSKNHEVPLDAPSGGDIKVETEIRKDIARALQIEATEPSTGWVSAVCRSLPEGSPAYRLAELIRDGVAEAYAAKGLHFAGEDRHMEFTMAGKLLNLTKKQIERAKKQIAMALIRRPEATGMMERVKKSKKRGANLMS